MKLNPDCTRAILLAIEKVCDMNHYFSSECDLDKINGDFTIDEIAYHARQCDMAGMFYKYVKKSETYWEVCDLTPKAHNFLTNIREDTIWNGVKSIAAKIGSKSMDAVVQIASNVVTELIKAQFGLSSTP